MKWNADFVAHSFIVSGDGDVVSAISNKPGVICAEVELGDEKYVPFNTIPEGIWKD